MFDFIDAEAPSLASYISIFYLNLIYCAATGRNTSEDVSGTALQLQPANRRNPLPEKL